MTTPTSGRETQLVKAAMILLTHNGFFVWRNNTGAVRAEYKGKSRFIRYGAAGSPDIIGMTPGGRFLGVECKTPSGKQTAHQTEFMRRVRESGGVYVLCRDLDDLDGLLGEGARR